MAWPKLSHPVAPASTTNAQKLAEAAAREPREIERRHLLDLVAVYQRAADAMAPAPEATGAG